MFYLAESNIEKIRSQARFINGYSRFLDSKGRERLLELKKTNAMLRSFVMQKRTGGLKLTQAAAVLLTIPDPVTDVAAIPVLIAAQIMKMKSKKRSEIQRILEGVNSNFTSLFSLAELSSF